MKPFATNRAGEPIVLVERRGHVGIVVMNRPEARNAMSEELTEALERTFTAHEADDDIWVHIITGVGDLAFCAGADLKAVSARPDGFSRERVAEMWSRRPEDLGFGGITPKLEKPIIAVVNGVALGGGAEMCLACDLIVAEEQAEFGLPEVRRGIVAGGGGMERLPRRIPPALALEAILTGLPYGAKRAYEIGLVNRLVPKGQGMQAAVELAEAICECAPLAVRLSKAVARASFALGEEMTKTKTLHMADAMAVSEDSKEGVRAFVEKRPPRWTGR